MKIRWKVAIAGTVHGVEGVKSGDIQDVDDKIGARYCRYHLAEPVVDRKEERAVAPRAEERSEPEAVGPDEQKGASARRPRQS